MAHYPCPDCGRLVKETAVLCIGCKQELPLVGSGEIRFAVVGVETTGLYNSDRVVEVAAVTVSRDGSILYEWDTLVNPGRDVGPNFLRAQPGAAIPAVLSSAR